MSSTTAPTTVRLSEDSQAQLAHLAKLTNRSKSYLINQAVTSYLAKNTAYLQDLDEAVASIDSEPSYDVETVFAWMDTWGSEKRKSFSEAVIAWNKNS